MEAERSSLDAMESWLSPPPHATRTAPQMVVDRVRATRVFSCDFISKVSSLVAVAKDFPPRKKLKVKLKQRRFLLESTFVFNISPKYNAKL